MIIIIIITLFVILSRAARARKSADVASANRVSAALTSGPEWFLRLGF